MVIWSLKNGIDYNEELFPLLLFKYLQNIEKLFHYQPFIKEISIRLFRKDIKALNFGHTIGHALKVIINLIFYGKQFLWNSVSLKDKK